MYNEWKKTDIWFAAAAVVALALMAAPRAQAEVPPDVETQLRQIGNGVCVPETAKLYKPLQPKAPYAGVTVMRDISYAQDPRTIMDVFAPEKGGGNRPVSDVRFRRRRGQKIKGRPMARRSTTTSCCGL